MGKLKVNKRSLTRLIAIQVLYQYNFYQGKEKIDDVIDNIVDNYLLEQEAEIKSYRDKIDMDFLRNLVLGLLPIVDEIDEDVKEFLRQDYSLEKLPEMMLITLRFACFELKFLNDTPTKVIINEYVDIAASFFDKKKITFVNSILENLGKKYRQS